MSSSIKKSLIIESVKKNRAINIREIWEYRSLIFILLGRDIKTRYKQTALGPLWIVISPLATTLVFSILLGRIARLPSENIPYPVFTYTGILAWSLFSRTTSSIVSSMRNEISLMSKVFFPRIIPALVQVCSNLVDFMVSFVILFILFAIYGIVPSWHILYLPLFILLIIFSSLTIGLWLSGPNVKFRDISNGITLILTFLQYFSPVVYSAKEVFNLLPAKMQFIYYYNPFTFFVEGFRWAILDTSINISTGTFVSYLALLILFIGGLYYFRKWETRVVDIQ